jgi:hypothetical protein
MPARRSLTSPQQQRARHLSCSGRLRDARSVPEGLRQKHKGRLTVTWSGGGAPIGAQTVNETVMDQGQPED